MYSTILQTYNILQLAYILIGLQLAKSLCRYQDAAVHQEASADMVKSTQDLFYSLLGGDSAMVQLHPRWTAPKICGDLVNLWI